MMRARRGRAAATRRSKTRMLSDAASSVPGVRTEDCRTTVELIKQRNDDPLVFEDDVDISAFNKTYVEHVIRTHPDDRVIRWDCWGYSCRRSARVRNCWCGGTHMVLYRLTRFKQSRQEFYESNLGDIDCILNTHPIPYASTMAS